MQVLRCSAVPRAAVSVGWRGMAAGVPTGPQGGYNEVPEETAILAETEEQHQQDRANAEKLVHQQVGMGRRCCSNLLSTRLTHRPAVCTGAGRGSGSGVEGGCSGEPI